MLSIPATIFLQVNCSTGRMSPYIALQAVCLRVSPQGVKLRPVARLDKCTRTSIEARYSHSIYVRLFSCN